MATDKPLRDQWWLAKLDQYGNVREMVDGSHNDAAGAHQAYYLHQRFGFVKPGVRYAVVECRLHEPVPDRTGVNEDALQTLNGIGLKPASTEGGR